MEVTKETVNDLFHGHVVVGTSRVRVVSGDLEPMQKGILIRTPGADDPTPNTVSIWVGGIGVTADSNSSTGGMPLVPGESMFIPLAQIENLYAVSTAVGQDLAWLAM